tara:strand:+ start:18000 stop:18722 length:723 start_codon:yes stop_codon:yes gene_type:complete
MKEILIVIPARYSSSRFPGKPLKKINNKSMLKMVWMKCAKVFEKDKIIIATEDQRIVDHCNNEGMKVILTSNKCKTGTDRVYEVSKKINADIYINVQGDEPMISSGDIKKFISFAKKNSGCVINAMTSIKNKEDYLNYNIPKVVTNNKSELLYMSRSPIPGNKEIEFIKANKQVCIYAFPKVALKRFGESRKKTKLEKIEDIEILRFIEMGYKVKMIKTKRGSYSVDTPKDLRRVRGILK